MIPSRSCLPGSAQTYATSNVSRKSKKSNFVKVTKEGYIHFATSKKGNPIYKTQNGGFVELVDGSYKELIEYGKLPLREECFESKNKDVDPFGEESWGTEEE